MACKYRRAWSPGLVLLLAMVEFAPMVAQGEQTSDRDPDWVAPAKVTSKLNPLVNRPEAALGGRKVFQQRCSSCHGEDGRGTTKAPDLAQPAAQAQSDGALFWKISSGHSRAGMPAFSYLPALQRWQLVLHLRAFASISPDAVPLIEGCMPQ